LPRRHLARPRRRRGARGGGPHRRGEPPRTRAGGRGGGRGPARRPARAVPAALSDPVSGAAILLSIKLTLVPAIIYAVTLAGRRWGARVAGRLSSFPVVAGPILLFVAIEQGAGFAAAAGAGTVAAVAAFAAYGLTYSWLATDRKSVG